jgi:hypothetical protein
MDQKDASSVTGSQRGLLDQQPRHLKKWTFGRTKLAATVGVSDTTG